MDEREVGRSADDNAVDPESSHRESSGLESSDLGQRSPEPRSYDPFDETFRPSSPAWDSWADPPTDFPARAVHRDGPPPPPYQPDPPAADPDATQKWQAVPTPADQASVDEAPVDQAPVDQTQPERAQLGQQDEDFGEPTVGMKISFDDPEPDEGELVPEPDQPSPDHASPDQPSPDQPAIDSPEVDPNHDDPAGLDPADSHSDDDEDTAPVTVPVVHADQMIADRFRLEEQLADRDGFLTWRAFDVKLSRPVLVHLLSQHDERSESVLAAARDAATATDSAFLRVLDAATASDDVAYVVCEFVVGKSLETLLAEGPLSGLEAAWVLREVARAMAPMHAKGLFHQRLNPDTIIISSTGNVRIVGFLIDAALTPRPEDHAPKVEQQEADIHALGQLLYAMLVSRWPVLPDEHLSPGERFYGLAPAPMDADGWLTPRQVRAGVSPALDQLCDEVLHAEPRLGGEPLSTASEIDTALERVLGTADASSDLSQRVRHTVMPVDRTDSIPHHRTDADDEAHASSQATSQPDASVPPVGATPESPRPRPPRHRTWLRLLLGLIAVVLVASLIAVGVRNGRRSADPAPAATSQGPVVHPISKVDDFDPQADGGNGEESPNTVALAWDKKPATAWTTVSYLNNAKLGGLKPGVGLVVDLGQSVDVGAVKLTMQGSPTAVQLLVPKTDAATAATPPMKSIKDWKPVASTPKAGTSVRFALDPQVKTRYLLVYLTSLPNVGGNKYRGAIAEIEVTS